MSTGKIRRNASGQETESHLETLSDALRESNPFRSSRVSEPSPYDVDVSTVHGAEFDRLVGLAEQAFRGQSAVGVALLGGAGVGKSHLLSRLYRWANSKGSQGRKRAVYVFLHNLLADPDRLPRYVLKCVISSLTEGGRRPVHETELFGLVNGAAWQVLRKADPRLTSTSVKVAQAAYEHAYGGPANGDVIRALFGMLRYGHPQKATDRDPDLSQSAIQWLAGEEIRAEDAEALGLRSDGQTSAAIQDDQEVEQVLLAIARMAQLCERPFLLCIDQVDNLGQERIQGLSSFLHALLDHATNLVVIISGVRETLLKFQEDQVIAPAAWDRIAEYKVDLRRIRREEARQILEARLLRFFEPFEDLEPVKNRLQEDALFPLGRAWFERQLGGLREFRPRDVLMWARDAWDAEQSKSRALGTTAWLATWPQGGGVVDPPIAGQTLEDAIDLLVERKLKEHEAQRRLHPGSLPPDAGNLAGLVHALLDHCRHCEQGYTFRDVVRLQSRAGRLPPYDLLVTEQPNGQDRQVTSGVVFITNTGRSASEALKRLRNVAPAPDHRILVTDEERRPLAVGSTGKDVYDELVRLDQGKFEHVKLDFDQYVALDALEAVTALARVGDLEVEYPKGNIRPVTEAEVIASHHRKDRYRSHPLLRHLLTEEAPPPPVPPLSRPLDEKEVRQHVMAQLAWRLGMTSHEVAKGFVKGRPHLEAAFEAALGQVKEIASRMHDEGLIYATPNDDDLFLQRRT